MAEVTIYNSPIHSDSSFSAVYGETGPSWAQFHTGDDFIPYGSTPANPDIYSVSNGTVVETSNSTSAWHGNMVLIYDSTTGYYWRYCHMVAGSITVSQGQTVTINTKLGVMGATGNVTGVHLHLECATTQAWQYSTFVNPSTVLGVPNERGTIIHFGGSPPPPPPPPLIKNTNNAKKWGWFKMIKKVRYNI